METSLSSTIKDSMRWVTSSWTRKTSFRPPKVTTQCSTCSNNMGASPTELSALTSGARVEASVEDRFRLSLCLGATQESYLRSARVWSRRRLLTFLSSRIVSPETTHRVSSTFRSTSRRLRRRSSTQRLSPSKSNATTSCSSALFSRLTSKPPRSTSRRRIQSFSS